MHNSFYLKPRIVTYFLFGIVLFSLCGYGLSCSKDFSPKITLSSSCPPGFELTDSNTCKCLTLYDQYNSQYGLGVGGLKTGLPKVRDGFSPQQIDLGRYLFFDPILSGDKTLACASCHNPDLGFSDNLGRSLGHNKEPLPRSAPSLWNVAFLKSFFWDARATSLETQMQGPLFATTEMNNTPTQLLQELNGVEEYVQLFKKAFPNRKEEKINAEQVYLALAAFESSLISLNSRYDKYAHGYADALNPNEIEGLNVFRSFVARCSECHTPPLFTNQQLAALGTPEPAGMPRDLGAETTFKDASMRGSFKVPSLRNIAKTSPYMHSGKFASLLDVVTFYNSGRGNAIPKGEEINIHWHIWEPNLSKNELLRLVDFLNTLTDESFKPATPIVLPSGLKMVHQNYADAKSKLIN